jgi:PAS domain S-box-containing protein
MNEFTFALSIFCVLSSFVTFGLGIAAYVRNPQAATNRLFCLTMIAAAFWGFGEFMIWHAGTPGTAWFWLKASSAWPFVVAFMLHFIFAFTSHPFYTRHRPVTLAFIYIPAGLIAAVLLLTDWVYTIRVLPDIGIVYIALRDSPAYQFEAAYILSLMLAAVVIMYGYWQRAETKNIRDQARLICGAIATVIFFGFLSGILFPALSIYTPNLVFIGLIIFSVIITRAISRHELFVLSPRTAVPDILRAMPDAMILADLNGTIISTNDAAGPVLGMPDRSLAGMQVTSCIPEQVFSRIHDTVLAKGSVMDIETVPAGPSGRTVSIAGSLVRDPAGDPAGVVLIVRDVTERKAAEEALFIAGRKISLLTQVTRHDVNNLVSALSGFLLLLKECPDDPERDSYLSAGIEIAEKIHRQLQFTREYQEIGSKRPLWLDLAAEVSRAAEDLACERLVRYQDLVQVELFADPMLVKVIYNILENAVRHGGEVTAVEIAATPQDDGTLKIIFEDNGGGVPDTDKEQIFRYGVGNHTGLGLAVSRDILSLTGISITETGVYGTGARFEMIVPVTAWRQVP